MYVDNSKTGVYIWQSTDRFIGMRDFFFVPIISAVLMVPSVGGLGVREGATVFLLTQAGVSESQAFALALAFDITLLVNGSIGAIIYIMQGLRGTR